MRSIITTLILLSSLFIGCSKEYSKKIEPEYKEVALKYEKNMIRKIYHKPTNELTQEQKEHHYERFLEYFNSNIKEDFSIGDVSPNLMASYLNIIWETVMTVTKKYKPEYKDSIYGNSVLIGFSSMYYSSDDGPYQGLLKDAKFFDFVKAYTIYLPQSVKEKANYFKRDVYKSELLALYLIKPSFRDGALKDAEHMAFVYIRRNILLRKLRDSFSEKQKMYMEENSILFLESLDEKQAKIYREFNKYNEYLE